MASETFRSMYKPKLKEENTTMSRRKSRGVERKQLRADEVNKRRHVSNDISIVEEDHNTEDGHDHAILAHSPHKKAESLADRLKKWREEKKKQREEAKNFKKPMFKVSSNVQGSSNSDLFIRKEKVTPAGAMLKSAKPSSSKESLKRNNVLAGKPESKQVTNSRKENPVKPLAIVQVAKPSSNRITRSNTKLGSTATKGAVKSVAETKKISGATFGSQTDKTKEKPSGLYTKLTEAAKAKVNLGKPKEFLRAKVHVNVPTKGTKTKAKNGSPERDSPRLPKDKDVAPNRKLSECAAVCAGASHLETSSFESEQGLHLSDSNVSTPKHSTPRRIRISSNGLRSASGKKYRKTPAARHSAPLQKKTPRRSSRNISAIHCTPKKPVDQLPEKDRTPLTTAEKDSQVKNSPTLTAPGHNRISESMKRKDNRKDKENCLSEENAGQLLKSAAQCSSLESAGQNFSVVITRLGSNDAPVVGDKGLEKNGYNSMNIRSSQKRKSKTMCNVQNHKTCDTTLKDSKSEILSNSVSKKNQQQEFTFAGENDENVEVQIPQKRLESSVTALIDNGSDEEMASPAKRRKRAGAQEQRYLDDETLSNSNDGIGLDKQVNFDVDLKSAKVDKKYHTRKSLRRGALAASTGNSSTTESESENIQFSPRASFGSRRSNGRRSGRKSSRSVVVSVSDEGTTDANGKNIIEEFHPNVEYHDVSNPFSPNRSGRKIKSRKSVMLTVSDEGTSMKVSGPQAAVVYHVKKPALSDGSSRPLQELAVEKMDGEVSFIEVPLDETTSESSFKKQQPASIDNIETTQAFIPSQSFSERTLSYLDTPPKHSLPIDSTTALNTISSPVTPRVLRSRGLSIGTPSTFKTPCQPVSAIKAKSGRRKTDSVKIKSPEEMVEILKRSPMVEMNRRKSRFLTSPASSSLFATQLVGQFVDEVQVPAAQVGNDSEKDEKVKYYRDLLVSEACRLNQLSDKWNEVLRLNSTLEEEIQGQIRSTVGKAQLLIDQRFKQFSGLVDNCQFGLGEQETTPTDLQGFWEMIYFQVQDVDHMFAALVELQTNNWEVKQPSPAKRVTKKKTVKIIKPRAASNFAAFRQEMNKRKAKAAVVVNDLADLATVNDSEEKYHFDGGFFKVTSPVRKYGGKKSAPLQLAVADTSDGADDLSNDQENKDLFNSPRFSRKQSYLPVVPSPLLNDISDLRVKRI